MCVSLVVLSSSGTPRLPYCIVHSPSFRARTSSETFILLRYSGRGRTRCADQEQYAKLADEWKARQAADVEAKAAELLALQKRRDGLKARLEAYEEHYRADLAELAELEVRACGAGGAGDVCCADAWLKLCAPGHAPQR